MIFIDSNYLMHAPRAAFSGRQGDIIKCRDAVLPTVEKPGDSMTVLTVDTGVNQDFTQLISRLRAAGITAKIQPRKGDAGRPLMLAAIADFLATGDEAEELVLIGGHSDYAPMLEVAKSFEIKVVVAGFNPTVCEALRKMGEFIQLDERHLLDK